VATKRDSDSRADQDYHLPGLGDAAGSIPERFYEPDELLAMLPICDYVVLVVPTTPETRGLIGERELRAMKPDSFLINVARGEILEEQTLIRALEEKWIAGAALDVFSEEPLPEHHPLWDLDNVIVSPHVAGSTSQYEDRASDLFAENLKRFLEGHKLLNAVNRSRGY
jgi:phosphoglycerate dehydrogenase-like enzyme